jgi:hypothetical protein
MKMRFLIIITILILFTDLVQSQITSGRKPYKFDMGLLSDEGSIQISRNNLYQNNIGYGWIKAPDYEFFRENLVRYRDNFTIDGVTAQKLSFQADIPSGLWAITLWIESGFEDSSTTFIEIGNIPQDLNWQTFNPPAEPRRTITKLYRIYTGKFEITGEPFSLYIESILDSVRLLGFTLIPLHENPPGETDPLFAGLQKAGKYNSAVNLDSLRTSFPDNPDNDYLYWKQQLNLLIEAEKLLEMMGWEWATVQIGLGLFDRYFQTVMILDAIINQKNSPFYERALWLRSKVLFWLNLERGAEHEKAISQKGLQELFSLYPHDQILSMYNGNKVFSGNICDSVNVPSNAPLWSKLQYESLCRLQDEIDWWVNVRQAPNGELGGKLGDDVEILRGWHPAILSGDLTALRGWEKLADCVWESPLIYKGYSKKPDDVEHSSEFISDTTPELVFFTDDDKYLSRLKYSVDHFENLWTGIADNGMRYFRSAWFSSTEVDTIPPKNRDVEMNTRAVKAVRYFAWKTADKKTTELLHQWASAWVDAALRTDKGKPAGIIPPSVSFPSAEINGDEENWYNANMFWNYFNWEHSAGSKMLEQLLFTYLLTNDTNLLQPLFLSLEMISKDNTLTSTGSMRKGSREWAVAVITSKKDFWNTVEQYRYLTSDDTYDELIMKYGTPYARYRLTGNIKYIEDALADYLDNIRYNSPLRTTEVLHTDRVYYPGSDYIKAMLTGDGTREGMSPYYSVSWENTNRYLTALVEETGYDKLRVQIFSYSPSEHEITMRLWQLKEGTYSLEIVDEAGRKEYKEIDVANSGERIKLLIPPGKLITVSISNRK